MLCDTLEYDEEPWKKHRHAVAAICKKMKQATRDQAGPSHARKVPCSASSELSGLNQVVQIRLDESTASVEPNVTMGALVRRTMMQRLIPTVIASSEATTVADAFATETCGSSSFRFGTFDCAVLSLEGVRHDGQNVMVKLSDGDAIGPLFEDAGAPHSLALITLLEIALIPACKYVEMTYWPVSLVSDAWLRITPKEANSSSHDKSAVDDSTDFVDSIMFDWSLGVVVTGRITSAVDHIRSGLKDSDTFVQHAESIGSKLQGTCDTHVETVLLIDYLFRYDVGPVAHRKRHSDSCIDSLVTQDRTGGVQDVILFTHSEIRDVVRSHWCESTAPISMARVESHSTFGRRRLGVQSTLDGVRWHVQAAGCERKKKSN
ncbi:hypothetical protein IG631_23567 [Alternaria alternata]|nr:hypothetical protein IG631_23567 [Alternaria alternata]